jgi:N,N'-diacetyllegionaminate synthase
MMDVNLENKKIGDGHPCYFIAEIGNSFKNFQQAKLLIDLAKEAGVDAVKFQTFEAETVTTKSNMFDMEVTGKISQYEFLKKLQISKELQREIVNYAKKINMTIFSAPSHIKDLDVLNELDLPAYKIGSDLACHIPLLKKIAKFQKPIILSTGMCTFNEVEKSVQAILNSGNKKIILLHCISNYPANLEEANLNAILEMKKKFDIPVGYSDHVIGSIASITAATLGANVIERHFHDSKNGEFPDDIHALDVNQFKELIQMVKKIELARGTGIKKPTNSEKQNLLKNRVSIIAMEDIKSGDVVTEEKIDIRRPGNGIQPAYFEQILGKKAKKHMSKDNPIQWDMIEQ